MKVSILTYHREDNYGAVMQAYATYKGIVSLGHTAEFIDLRLPNGNKSIISKLVFALKHYRFNQFRKRFLSSETPITYYSLEELKSFPPNSDCYLVGSDQTWNPLIAKELLPAFFLDFGDEKQKRTSYATSIGLREWPGSKVIKEEDIIKCLSRFDTLLLREDSAIEIVKERWGKVAEKVVDPVLLFPDYSELIGTPKESDEIIVYKLIDDSYFYDQAFRLSKKMNLPIRSIGSVRRPKGFRASYPEGVTDWVRRLATAKFLLTDSFHGTVFALLYHRPFIVYVGDPARLTRISELLSNVGLEDRILSHNSSFEEFINLTKKIIDWNKVDKYLAALREQSIALLQKALSE